MTLYKKYLYKVFTQMIIIFLFFACRPNVRFTEVSSQVSQPSIASSGLSISENFKLLRSETNLVQKSLEQNKSTVSFQVLQPNGLLLQDLSADLVRLSENSVPVTIFNLTKNSSQFRQTVDIIFAVDVTGSMTNTIESAKVHLINFVKNSRNLNYHTRLCLITFGDYTVQSCHKFYDNDPSDESTQAQVDELISEIVKLKALKGAQDPGGKDLSENPLRALIDAAKSPWALNNQRFLILMTDADFLYSPGHSGTVGALAPDYNEVKQALEGSQMKVFAVTPSLPGYNQNFGSDLGIVSLSHGEWFNFSDLISGRITLNTILDRIMTTVNTTFVIDYIVDNFADLDAGAPLVNRKINLQLKSSQLGVIQQLRLQSNLPNGRENYPSAFHLTDKKIDSQSLKILVNGEVLNTGYSVDSQGLLQFVRPPEAGAKIQVSYFYENLRDAIVLKPILFDAINSEKMKVFLNHKLASSTDIILIKTTEGLSTLSFSDRVLSEEDPYDIRAHGELQVDVQLD